MMDEKDTMIDKLKCENKELRHVATVQSALFNKLRIEILGSNYYIVDPVGGLQAEEIITHKVIEAYKRVERQSWSWYQKFKHLFKGVVAKW